MIASGEKKEEYRAVTLYWEKRLLGKQFDIVRFRNGYSRNAPTIDVEFQDLRTGKAELKWSQNANELYYIISLGKIVNEQANKS